MEIKINNNPIHDKRLRTMVKLDEEYPEKYCWTELVMIALETDRELRGERKDDARYVEKCKRKGTCYCGKFTDGKLNQIKS